ncbi:TIM23 complex component [Pseudogymnoascus destructans]|uniref:Presequence translocated-associated motor subunit PAM17 n=2 Tax=Pseudogymnoascus destructans TaxID=655981 RepID=L8FNU6_PSED2|nr:TIM23 complex component [Pseudogymnoascus destructans]ELR02118.1 hypothetical protein GMDG_05277 [Pseudogymnoascus destructans 20631-21]OAF56814.1 TIM23 complex component [Pseudogymnoascus destructans]
MLARTELCLRTAAVNCRFQPSLTATNSYHTTIPSKNQPQHPQTSRPGLVTSKKSPSQSTSEVVRYASTTASTDNTASTAQPSTSSADQLTWNAFFKLRKTRRRIQLGSSVGTSFGGMLAGAQALAVSDMDSLVGQVPLDPFITLGLITFSCGGVGWLLGPIVGTGIFNTMNRKYIPDMAAKEVEFYKRVRKFRVDPSASSMANPVPDYYGEKISSVAGYRQWLKDQRAFNKKRTTYVA